MKNTLKRLLCLLLAAIMCLGLAFGALAEGEDDNSGGDGSSNTGNNNESDGNIYATVFKLDKTSIEIYEGAEASITYDLQPNDCNMEIKWSSENEDIATVDSAGNVTAVSKGTTNITAAVSSGPTDNDVYTQSCSVTVKENTVQSVKIKSTGDSNKIEGKGELQLYAYAVYSDKNEVEVEAQWSSSNTDVVTVSSKGLVTSVGRGTAKITAETDYGTATFDVTVTDNAAIVVSGGGVQGGNGKYTLSMSGGGSVKLSAEVQPSNAFAQGEITWESNKTNIATVDGGTVRAVANGTAVITVKCGSLSATVTVTVGTPAKDIKSGTSYGTTIKGLKTVEADLRDAYEDAYGSEPESGMTITLTPPTSTTYGTLYKNSSTSSSNRVTKSASFPLEDVRKMYFVPGSVGDYVMSYSLFSSGSKTALMTGKITITVSSKSRDVTITLSDDAKSYTFSSNANVEKTAATTLINNAVKDATGKSSYSYLLLDTSSVSSSSRKVGTLYANSSKKSLDTYNNYTYSSGGSSPVSKLYFVPEREGTYKIDYTACDSAGNELCSGDLIIEVGAVDDASVTVNLDDDSNYTFSEKTSKDKISAATAINDAIKDESGKTYSYIKFGSVSSGSSVGTLYSSSNKGSISTSREYSRSTSASYSVSDLYFVPEKSGTYVRSFTAYDSNDNELLDGTLKIVVPGQSSGGEMDIYFNTTTGSTISLGEDVFESWFRQQKGSGYKLAYVTFDDANRSFGTFKHSSSSFTPGNDVRYYTDSYSGSTGSGAKYLDNVKYTAGSSTGYISVDFTCCGGTSASSTSTRLSGSFCVFVTKNSVKTISYDAASAVTLDESDFSSTHKNAMSSGSSSTKYYIELLEIPAKGTLHYNYTSSSRTGTRLTNSNFDDYKFHVNYSSSYDSVEDLTYVPASNSTGNVTVRYMARDTDGEPMYVGSITFSCGKQEQNASINCGADGYTFKLSDFYNSGDSDPVAYVTFRQPASGELTLNYVNGRGVPVDSSVRLYTKTPSNGAYPVSSLSFIPKAGFSGNVSVEYTAVTESGKSSSGTLVIHVSSKKSSSRFKDVTSSGSGAWASDSIDYAYKWGLVNGTGEDTFSPDSTMSRAMLVTILYRAAGSPKVSGTCKFSDVPSDAYYYNAVIWASDNGIVTGTSSTTFSPNRDVNREQVAAFLHRFAKYNGESVSATGSLSGYTDQSSVSAYAVEPISWAVQRGYITSASATDKVLSPGGNATRAQVAVMIHRFLTY